MLSLKIKTQPDDTTCGPTSLHAVYRYYGDTIPLQQVIDEVSSHEEGGTLAVWLACHALERGYQTTLYTYNLGLFDPTWFKGRKANLRKKLLEQAEWKEDPEIDVQTKAYIDYLNLGGKLKFKELTISLLRTYLNKKIPILTGLSATYLYDCAREYSSEDGASCYDDVKGYPMGHFVLLSGLDEEKQHVNIADPYKKNPVSGDNYYSVKIRRLLHSIMLGIMTHDANLLIIEPKTPGR